MLKLLNLLLKLLIVEAVVVESVFEELMYVLDFAQIIGFYGEVAAEDRYLWPFCISIEKRMGQIDDLVLPSCLQPQSAA